MTPRSRHRFLLLLLLLLACLSMCTSSVDVGVEEEEEYDEEYEDDDEYDEYDEDGEEEDEVCDPREVVTDGPANDDTCFMTMLDEFELLPNEDRYAPHMNDYPLQENQVDLFRWKDDATIIDAFAARIGLPPTLIPTIQDFALHLNIFRLLHSILYDDPCDSDRGRFYHQVHRHSQYIKFIKLLWAVQRPGNHFSSDMHWFAPANEVTHEFFIKVLLQSGFRSTLQAIGEFFNLDSLTIQSVGFLFVSHAENKGMHTDFEGVQGKTFNLLIPIILPVNSTATEGEFKIIDKNDLHCAVKMENNVGILVGDRTWHGTRDCDHTSPTQEMRVMLSIYLADLTEENVGVIAQDRTAVFPVQGEVDWLWAQRHRHWNKHDSPSRNAVDLGRRPFTPYDVWSECPVLKAKGDCTGGMDPFETRLYCPVSCEVYVPDTKYQPGVDRNVVFGEWAEEEEDEDDEDDSQEMQAAADLDRLHDGSSAHRIWKKNEYTLDDFFVGGINLAAYGREPLFELFQDFDLSAHVRGNEDWDELIGYRRDLLQRPSLSFYVDKVARKRWFPTQNIPQPAIHFLAYGDELVEDNNKGKTKAEEQALSIYKCFPTPSSKNTVISYAAKPTHMSMTKGMWLVDHYYGSNGEERILYSRNGKAVVSGEDHDQGALHPRQVAEDLQWALDHSCDHDESWALKHVSPGIVVEERWTSHLDPMAPPHEFCIFTIWGRLWVGQWNFVKGNNRWCQGFVYRNGTYADANPGVTGTPQDLPDWIPWPRLVAIAERLGAHKDMFRTDIFVGRPANSSHDAPLEIAVSESEIYPTTTFPNAELPNEGARLWLAGYSLGIYKLVPNWEVPEEFVRTGKLTSSSSQETYGCRK